TDVTCELISQGKVKETQTNPGAWQTRTDTQKVNAKRTYALCTGCVRVVYTKNTLQSSRVNHFSGVQKP
ncbi:MAG: hypothetical protein ABGW81_02285, partial [Paracoccaceae bacterium]